MGTLPLNFSDLQELVQEAFMYLDETIIDCGAFYFTLWDIVVFGATTSGIAWILQTFISGGND